jgi:hypothetical protein
MRHLEHLDRIMRPRTPHPGQTISFNIRGKKHRVAAARQMRNHGTIIQAMSTRGAIMKRRTNWLIG